VATASMRPYQTIPRPSPPPIVPRADPRMPAMPADCPDAAMSRLLRVAINGYGRIDRCVLRALAESPYRRNLSVVAINEPADLDSMAYLTRFDSTHGIFPGEVRVIDDGLEID